MRCFAFPGNRLRAVVRAPFVGMAAVGLACLLMALPARGDLTTNELCRQPVCVDGVPTDEECPANELSFVIGSLFDGKDDPFQNSRAAYAIGQDEEDPYLPYVLYVMFESGLRTRAFTPGEVIGKFTFPAKVYDVSRPNFTVWLVGVATTDPDAAKGCKAFFDLDGNGSFEGLAATLGIKAGISFGLGSFSPPAHLRGEVSFRVKALGGFFSFLPAGQAGIFPVPGPTPLNGFLATDQSSTPTQASSAVITFAGTGTTTSNSNGLPIRAVIDVKPGNSANTIGSGDNGVLSVAILTTLPRLNALQVVVSSLRLRDPNLNVPGAKPKKDQVITKDVDGDGKLDVVVQFDLKNAGALNANTKALQLTGTLSNGRLIQGMDTVRIVP